MEESPALERKPATQTDAKRSGEEPEMTIITYRASMSASEDDISTPHSKSCKCQQLHFNYLKDTILTAIDFQNHMGTLNDYQRRYDFGHNFKSQCSSDGKKLQSLQWLARKTVIQHLTLKRIKWVPSSDLPLPVKRFLSTFQLNYDFDLENKSLTRLTNFRFFHQHATHKVYLGTSKLDNMKILLKVVHTDAGECTRCRLGTKLPIPQKAADWMAPNLPNVMECVLKMVEPNKHITYYIFEAPVINLNELCFRFRDSRTKIPEHLIWDFVNKTLTTLQYLEERNLCCPLYETCHFVFDKNGNVKLENLILYLSSDDCARYSYKSLVTNCILDLPQTTLRWRLLAGVRALSLVYYECVTLAGPHYIIGEPDLRCPTYDAFTLSELLRTMHKPSYPQMTYSPELKRFIFECMNSDQCGHSAWFERMLRESAVKATLSFEGDEQSNVTSMLDLLPRAACKKSIRYYPRRSHSILAPRL